jgi:trk system potassium uptake protein TrkA
MKIIVVGIGKLGDYLSKSLVRDLNDVTLVDVDFEGSRTLINNEDVNYVTGNGLSADILIEAGVKKCDLLISVMDSDEKNIICSLLAKKLGAKNTIARIRDKDNNNSVYLLKKEIGISYIVNPEYLTALNIAKVLSIPSALEATTFLRGRLQMISLKIKEDSVLNGITINSLIKKCNSEIIICAVLRDGVTTIPKGSFKLKVNDKINVVGTIKDIKIFLEYADLISEPTKKVIIAGGGTTSFYLAKFLLDMNMKVKIVEINQDRCKQLSESLDKALIINADISNQNVLYEEGIEETDAFISLTSIDEENIVYSMFASLKKVPRIITKVNHIDLDGVI